MASCYPLNIVWNTRSGERLGLPALYPRASATGAAEPEPPDDHPDQQQADQIHQYHAHNDSRALNQRKRLALLTTVTDDMAMAAPAIIGLSNRPSTGYNTPAAIGTPSEL